jgi:FecR protein
MSSRNLLRSASLTLFSLLLFAASPCFADSSHVRIIRLSLVQGDVRFARDVKGDPLASQNATWEAAELNLPIRQGYVLATDKGRAEVEFENGSMAFLSDDTVLEFYDLSLEDGAKTTRLILRQGTASFYVNPANGDYFSVTGGDFSVEAAGRASFRLDNFDDGSVVNVLKGHVSILRKNQTTELAKGQSLSIRATDSSSVSIGQVSDNDDFDRWVSGRIDSVQAANNAAQQYVTSGGYTSGLGSLYTYGGWYPCAGFGNCWRPYGVGLGWSPFDSGFWITDASIGGPAFIGNQPWGWLPYHYGGWICDPIHGWLWTPGAGGYLYGNAPWFPVTGTWLHSRSGPVGIVPVHPLDVRGKTPINLSKGIFPVSGGTISSLTPVAAGQEWKVAKSVPGNTLSSNLATTTAPQRVSRTLVGGNLGAHVITMYRNSSIAYDAREHRFVNTNSAPQTERAQNSVVATEPTGRTGIAAVPTGASATGATAATVVPNARVATPSAPMRTTVPASRAMTPPAAPRGTETGRSGWSGGSGNFPSSRSSSSSATSTAAPHSAPAASSSAGSSSGGRPH